jgi:spore coat protein A
VITKRDFLKIGSAGSVGLLLTLRGSGSIRVAQAQIPGTRLAVADIPKYRTPLMIPPVMPAAGSIAESSGKVVDYYEISLRQFKQQILPAELPPTTVWGYGAVKSASKTGLLIHNAPSLTIEAMWNRPTRVKWINELRANPSDPNSEFLPHLLPVDPTLHWANPPGGTMDRDMRPTFSSTPGRYTGPVPMVTHVHGSVDVGDESDGYAEAWFLPAAGNIPADYAKVGAWYEFFANKGADKKYLAPGTTAWEPGTSVFQYPNSHRASTMWYHDHTLGITRVNVYAGPAGFFIIRGGPAGDATVLDSRTNMSAVLPSPAPKENDPFPPTETYYEIPIEIQDRAFNADGSLFYPNTRAIFDSVAGPYIPHTDIAPIWNPEFFGNCMVVNGNTWPFLNVEQRRYRSRFLNGCSARFLILDFSAIPGVEVWMIGNEGGFLAAAVNMTVVNGNKILMSPAERADVIVDFTNVPRGSYVLGNVGPDAPFAGLPINPAEVADPSSTGEVMQFRVGPALAPDPTTPPQFLVLPPIPPFQTESITRRVALLEERSKFFAEAPAELILGTIAGDPNTGTGTWASLTWMDSVTESPAVGATEVWEFYNATVDAHPMHIHEVLFEVANRQAIFVDEKSGTVQVVPGSAPQPREPWENGYKDTVIAYPGQVTRVRAVFNTPGQYVWHCHIVEHEDNEMMRPYRVGPVQPGQPRA